MAGMVGWGYQYAHPYRSNWQIWADGPEDYEA